MVSGAARIVFGIESVWIGLKCTSQLRLRSFDKPCSEKFVFSIWTSILIHVYENTSGYDTVTLQ